MDREEARAAALLDRRTTALATRAAAKGTAQTQQPLIIWALGDSLFGTEVATVAGVIPFAGCARVPTREPACLGVIGRAGRFYSVIDMRRLLGLAASDTRPRHLLLLHGGAPHLALAVDDVLGRFDLAAPSLGSAPALSFEGRLVAPFAAAELRARLRPSSPAERPLESMPS
jgi:chemotaxis signal transduction protein